MTGKFPIDQVDHINLDKLDNRWVNLREATNSQNQANIHAHITNTSGFKGVSWHRGVQKWRAQIERDGHSCYLGYFDTPEAAAAAYANAAQKHFGEFARVTTMKNENTKPYVQSDQSIGPVGQISNIVPGPELFEQPPPMKHHFEFTLEGEQAERTVSIAVGVIAAIVKSAKITNITIEK